MGEVIQLQGDQRKDVQEFLVDKKEGLALDAKTIKVRTYHPLRAGTFYVDSVRVGPRFLGSVVRSCMDEWELSHETMRLPVTSSVAAVGTFYNPSRALAGTSGEGYFMTVMGLK